MAMIHSFDNCSPSKGSLILLQLLDLDRNKRKLCDKTQTLAPLKAENPWFKGFGHEHVLGHHQIMTHLEFAWSFFKQKEKPMSSGKKGIKWVCIGGITALLWLLHCYFCSFLLACDSYMAMAYYLNGMLPLLVPSSIPDRKQSLNVNLYRGKHTFVLPFLPLSWFSFWLLCPVGTSHPSQWEW